MHFKFAVLVIITLTLRLKYDLMNFLDRGGNIMLVGYVGDTVSAGQKMTDCEFDIIYLFVCLF